MGSKIIFKSLLIIINIQVPIWYKSKRTHVQPGQTLLLLPPLLNLLPLDPSQVLLHQITFKLHSPKITLSWKTTILPYIKGNKILHHIDGSTSPPPTLIPSSSPTSTLVSNPEHDQSFELDQLLLSVLVSTISEPLLFGLTSFLGYLR